MPRSGIELTTSRLHSFIMAKASHTLNHSAMEALFLIPVNSDRITIYEKK